MSECKVSRAICASVDVSVHVFEVHHLVPGFYICHGRDLTYQAFGPSIFAALQVAWCLPRLALGRSCLPSKHLD